MPTQTNRFPLAIDLDGMSTGFPSMFLNPRITHSGGLEGPDFERKGITDLLSPKRSLYRESMEQTLQANTWKFDNAASLNRFLESLGICFSPPLHHAVRKLHIMIDTWDVEAAREMATVLRSLGNRNTDTKPALPDLDALRVDFAPLESSEFCIHADALPVDAAGRRGICTPELSEVLDALSNINVKELEVKGLKKDRERQNEEDDVPSIRASGVNRQRIMPAATISPGGKQITSKL